METVIASPVQSQFLLSSHLHPTPALNTITCAVRIKGPLDLLRLERALLSCIERQVALRTVVQLAGGNVVQVLTAPPANASINVVPHSGSQDAILEAAEQLRQSVTADSNPWQIQLLVHGESDHTLLFSAHRCIWDEVSTEAFAAQISADYNSPSPLEHPTSGLESSPGARGGFSSSVPNGTPSDVQTAELAREFAATLQDAALVHAFPLSKNRSQVLQVDTASEVHELSERAQQLVQTTASTWDVEPFLVMVAAASYVLAQYAGQQKLVVGLPFDRRAPGAAVVALGCNTAMLPIPIDCQAKTFGDLVRNLGSLHRAEQRFADVPFNALVKATGAHVDPATNPLFQIACVPDTSLRLFLGGCEVHPIAVPVPPQQLDLFLQFTGNTVRVAYAKALFEREIIASFLRSLSVFLEAALTEPDADLSRLPLLSDSDQHALVFDANRTDEPQFLGSDLYTLVSRHCRDGNDKLALRCAGQTITYAELKGAVQSLASRLAASNIGPGQLVGICLPRSLDMVVAMLAVWHCGAAYVPLDPAFPTERLTYMVMHSKLVSLITTTKLGRLFDGSTIQLIELDAAMEASPPTVQPVPGVSGDATAYVIYTSGSTGRPKGVAIPRVAVGNFLLSMLYRPGIAANDVLCAVTTLSFDIAVLELLAPLCVGATVLIATEEEARDARLLLQLLAANAVTVLQATPVTWQMLCSSGLTGSSKLKALCGGEALSPALAKELGPRVAELWNMYGPTETTVWSTCKRIEASEPPISVGTPIHNTVIYVLDEQLRALPAGVEGRLFIGGTGVAIGYLFDDELTSKRFLADPFRVNHRIYDTGDRARIGPNGELYVLGRSDFQVKIRGFRIELGEIESHLGSFEAIEGAVCHVLREDPANPELLGYFTLKSGAPAPSIADLRSFCAGVLPAHMVPTRFVRLDAFPRTPNGKIDRNALPRSGGPQDHREVVAVAAAAPRSQVERTLAEIWCSVLAIPSAGINDSFFELGGTSVAALAVAQAVAQKLGVEISIVKIFEHPTIAALARFVQGSQASSSFVRDSYERVLARRKFSPSPTAFDVAIIGAAGRFPGARNLDELWDNLCNGRETITVFPREELDPLVPARDRNDPQYIPARGVLQDSELFDAAFFNISPNEAELMDPQLRLFLETCWETFENAGYVGEKVDGQVGVWAGMGNNFYYHYNVLTRLDKLAIMGEIAAEIANEKDHIAPRVSHKLNLRGPSLSVHTACSTTLVVIENAYQALVSHQVDLALAGGVDIRTPQKSGQRFEEGGVFSDDGHCRPFDAAATGTMFGEGVGAVLLKRLDDAIRDQDTIYAVIKGAAVNHDGGRKVSYLAPSVEGQARVVASALGIGDVNPDTVSYIEAHGTATPIGDPIEVEALTQVFRAFTQRRHFCAIGSIKGNFGHATTAAGIAGVLKVVLCLRYKKIPPTLHYKTPNPRIDFASSPFYVNNKLIDWKTHGIARRAGVSSFGFCGTNAHVVLEEAPARLPSAEPSRASQLILLSARSAPALDDLAKRWSAALKDSSSTELADAAYTAQVGRKRFDHRLCVVVDATSSDSEPLVQKTGPHSASLTTETEDPNIAFMFPGQGAQYINMGSRLYRGESVFSDAIDRCAIGLMPHLECDLRTFLFPAPDDAERARESLNNTYYTQPAIFSIAYALATQMQSWGIRTNAFIGHSIGEFVAATLSGVMEFDDALRLVATRGRLMRDLPAGSMLTVRLPLEAVLERLPAEVDVAAVNGPEMVVVAGPTPIVSAFAERLTADGVNCRMLHTSHAFHSKMMDPVVDVFLRTVESVRLREPRIPFVSTVTGDWIRNDEAIDPNYWARHLRSTVLFSKAVQILLADEQQVLLECGPRRTCASLALLHRPKRPGRVLSTMPDSAEPNDEYSSLLLALGSLWLNGATPDWNAVHQHDLRHRVAMPPYAFQRKRFWLAPGDVTSFLGAEGIGVIGRQDTAPNRLEPVANQDNAQAPEDAMMRTVRSLVEELLGSPIESFDEHARFIMLGLDSLLLTQLARAVRARLGLEVTFRDLVERYSSPSLLVNAINASRPIVASTVDSDSARNAGTSTNAASNDYHEQRQTQTWAEPRLGRDDHGHLAWFVVDPARPGKYAKVSYS